MIKDCLKDTDVVVLAGGRGTRVASVLKNKPKILAPLGKRLFIDLLLNWLEYYGAKRIIFSLGFLSESIIRHLESIKSKSIEFKIVVEERPMGTAGAIRNVRNQIETDPILVVNGDSFVNADLCNFVNFHLSQDNKTSIICTRVTDVSRYGSVTVSSNNKVISFIEKKNVSGRGYISTGVYLFNRTIIDDISNGGPSLEKDYLSNQDSETIGAMVGDFEFLDIGTPETLSKAPVILGRFFK